MVARADSPSLLLFAFLLKTPLLFRPPALSFCLLSLPFFPFFFLQLSLSFFLLFFIFSKLSVPAQISRDEMPAPAMRKRERGTEGARRKPKEVTANINKKESARSDPSAPLVPERPVRFTPMRCAVGMLLLSFVLIGFVISWAVIFSPPRGSRNQDRAASHIRAEVINPGNDCDRAVMPRDVIAVHYTGVCARLSPPPSPNSQRLFPVRPFRPLRHLLAAYVALTPYLACVIVFYQAGSSPTERSSTRASTAATRSSFRSARAR
jgi:hypothetical protein